MSEPTRPDTRLTRWARRRAGILIGVLVALLGFGIAVQVRSHSSTDNFAGTREDDLIRILDDQNAHDDQLRRQIANLQQMLRNFQDSGRKDTVAEQQATQEMQALGVLLGTLPATGPGVEVTITDPQHQQHAEDLLDVVQELRGAGAEAIEFDGVRIGTSSAFTDVGGQVSLDGKLISAPYDVIAIGDPKTLDTALNIPGGVAATARNAGGECTVTEKNKVDITAVRTLNKPRYANPTGR